MSANPEQITCSLQSLGCDGPPGPDMPTAGCFSRKEVTDARQPGEASHGLTVPAARPRNSGATPRSRTALAVAECH